MSEEFPTVAEVAQRLKVTQQTVRNRIDRGQMTPTRVGERRVRVKLSDLEAYLGTTTSPPVAIATAPVLPAASAPVASGTPPVPDRADASLMLKAAQARKLHEAADMLLRVQASDNGPHGA
jgi:excisionase family DNA binding protein